MKPSTLITYTAIYLMAEALWNPNLLEVLGAALIIGFVLAFVDEMYDDLWVKRRSRSKA